MRGIALTLWWSLALWALILAPFFSWNLLYCAALLAITPFALKFYLTRRRPKLHQNDVRPLTITEMLDPGTNRPSGFRKPSSEASPAIRGGAVSEVPRPWSVEYYTQQRGNGPTPN